MTSPLDERPDVPERHRRFLEAALPRLAADARIVGVGAWGSFRVPGAMDERSDLDLVLAVDPERRDSALADRRRIAAGLGELLAAFAGDHVGEPALLICLYGVPLLHVDLKFVVPEELRERAEDPVVLWERDGALSAVLDASTAAFPAPDLQWIEDRFWTWIHYGADKVARGELFEALDHLALLRSRVLGPLILRASDARPMGVRRLEAEAPEYVPELRRVVGAHDAVACGEALRAAAELYLELRERFDDGSLERGTGAREAALEHLGRVRRRVAAEHVDGRRAD